MFDPVEYEELTESIRRSEDSAFCDRVIRTETYDRIYQVVLTVKGKKEVWPLDEWQLVRLAQERWARWIKNQQGPSKKLFFPDGRARPREQELLPQDAKWLLSKLRTWKKVSLTTPNDERRPGLQTKREDKLLVSRYVVWLPWEMGPVYRQANEYQKECRRLQATKAGRKAKRLLLENLTDIQRRDYLTKGVFTVAGNGDPTFHWYVIDNSFPNGNIFEIQKRRVIGERCLHPEEPYPIDDILLTQKLFIETDEKSFRKESNFYARDPEEYFVPDLNGYPIATANRAWDNDGHGFVPRR